MSEKDPGSLSRHRIIYLDYMRVAAILAVIILHVSVQNWHSADAGTSAWGVFNFFDSAVRWCVPVFVMISGTLFTGRDIPLKAIYSKYVLRLLIAFFAWSAAYALVSTASPEKKLAIFLGGRYHMWFIMLMIGLYMCMPVINAIASNEKILRYYLLLSFIFAFCVPLLLHAAEDFGGSIPASISEVLTKDVGNLHLELVLGYIGYFLLGHVLNRAEFTKKQRSMIYAGGIAGFAVTWLLTLAASVRAQSPVDTYYDFISLNVLLESAAVFTWFRYRSFSNGKINVLMERLSGYVFGVYLVHVMVLEKLDHIFGINSLSFRPVVSILLITLVVTVVSFAVSAVLSHIPFVKDHLV